MDLTRNEYRIISTLYENGCFSRLCSFRKDKLAELTNLSVYKIRDAMKTFLNLGIVEKGAKDVRADTYFLTEKGIKIAEDNMKVDTVLLEKIQKFKNEKGER